jgi:hypothetical protein
MIMRILGGCGAALFSFIFALEMSIASTGSGADPSVVVARKGDRLVPALYRDAVKKPLDTSVPSSPAPVPAIDGCELLISSLALPPSEHIAVRCLS